MELALGVVIVFLLFFIWDMRKHYAQMLAMSDNWRQQDRVRYEARNDGLLEDLDNERDAHTVTRERLYASWKDGHTIPAPPEPPSEPDLALPDELAPIWEVWEGTGQEKMKALLRQRIAQGRDVNSLLDEYGFLPPKE